MIQLPAEDQGKYDALSGGKEWGIRWNQKTGG
jgi:hypothetical protein